MNPDPIVEEVRHTLGPGVAGCAGSRLREWHCIRNEGYKLREGAQRNRSGGHSPPYLVAKPGNALSISGDIFTCCRVYVGALVRISPFSNQKGSITMKARFTSF